MNHKLRHQFLGSPGPLVRPPSLPADVCFSGDCWKTDLSALLIFPHDCYKTDDVISTIRRQIFRRPHPHFLLEVDVICEGGGPKGARQRVAGQNGAIDIALVLGDAVNLGELLRCWSKVQSPPPPFAEAPLISLSSS